MNGKQCDDGKGNKFKSYADLFRFYGIDPCLGRKRLYLGWSINKIISTPSNNDNKNHTDHLGNKFDTDKEMYLFWGIDPTIGNSRKGKGWSIKKILTTPDNKYEHDHLGNKFNTAEEMYIYHNIPTNAGYSRKALGWSMEKTLTTPVLGYKKDPITGQLLRTKDLCNKYGVNRNNFNNRFRKMNIYRALEISFIIRSQYTKINQTKYNLTVVKRIKKGKDVFECYIDNEDGTSTFKIMSYDMIDQYCIDQYKKLHNIE